MNIKRRDLLRGALPFSAALFLESSLQPLASQDQGLEQLPFDTETYNFWTEQAHAPSQSFAEHGRLVAQRGPALTNQAEFLFYSSDLGFVRAASTQNDTPVSRTLLEKGDPSLLLSVDMIRPSSQQLKNILNQKNGSLRVDLKQGVPLQQLSETLNWSAIASLLPAGGGFSGYHEITFDPKSTWGQAKKVPLTGGIGFWSWNFSTQSKSSSWTQMMQFIDGSGGTPKKTGSDAEKPAESDQTLCATKKSSGSKGFAGMVLGLGLPSMARTALCGFNDLFGTMLAKGGGKTAWIIHNTDTPLLATLEARQKHPGHAVALRTGSYVVTDIGSAQQLLSGKYELKDGIVAPAGTKDADLEASAKSTLPDVSYIALSTVVQV